MLGAPPQDHRRRGRRRPWEHGGYACYNLKDDVCFAPGFHIGLGRWHAMDSLDFFRIAFSSRATHISCSSHEVTPCGPVGLTRANMHAHARRQVLSVYVQVSCVTAIHHCVQSVQMKFGLWQLPTWIGISPPAVGSQGTVLATVVLCDGNN